MPLKTVHSNSNALESNSSEDEQSYSEISTEALQNVVPAEELINYYKEKFHSLTSEYVDLLHKVENCKSACELNSKIEQELVQRNCEVLKLKQIISDLQLSVHEEQEQVLRLRSENDRLQIQIAEDRKKIDLLLRLNSMSEEDMNYFTVNPPPGSVTVPRILPKRRMKQEEGKKGNSENSSKDQQGDNDKLHQEYLCLQARLDDQIRFHRTQMNSVLKDRELIRKEWNHEHHQLNGYIAELSAKLKDTKEKLCESVKELITIKKDVGDKELKWKCEMKRILKDLHACEDKVSICMPRGGKRKSNQELCAEVDALKAKLREKENLEEFCKDRFAGLEKEVFRYRDLLDKAKSRYQDQVQKLVGQLAYLKRKQEDMDRRRKLEAEGYYNDVKILRRRLQDMEKSLQKLHGTSNRPPLRSKLDQKVEDHISALCKLCHRSLAIAPSSHEMIELYSTAQETRKKSRELDKDMEEVRRKIEELTTLHKEKPQTF